MGVLFMKNLIRILSLMLAAFAVFSSFGVGAYAASGKQEGTFTQTETKRYTKHGVVVRNNITYTYKYNSKGKKVLVGTKEDKTYLRLAYHATYNELLPDAKANRNNYASQINEVLKIINGMRAEKGLKPLALGDKLTEQANVRAEEIAWSGKFSHYRPNFTYFSTIFRSNGFSSGKCGENVGRRYSTPAGVCQAWKESETHYANIMNPDFKYVGVGISPNCDSEYSYIWVLHFYSGSK